MSNRDLKAARLAALALFAGSAAYAVPVSIPNYTFCEDEINDYCDRAQYINALDAIDEVTLESATDCFYITGKLQADCVWDIAPKCALVVYGKPQPARTSTGAVIPNNFCEPIIASSNEGILEGVTPIDGAVRLAVAALTDAFDGTVNGLNNNGRHNERGEVTIKVRYNSETGERVRPDQKYTFHFQNGSDALRWAIVVPSDTTSVDIECDNETGTVEVCYDIDFYHITGLEAGQAYAVQVIGGLTPECVKTDTVLGIYNKECIQIAFDDDGGQDMYSQVITYAEIDGSITVAVSGKGDEDFNGLLDATQQDYFDFLNILDVRHDLAYTYYPGSSTKDDSEGDVIRYPRSIWDDTRYTAFFSPGNPPESRYDHGICGGYCIKVSVADHVSSGPGGSGGSVMTPARADVNADGFVNAQDLALMLSYWGTVAN
jgi:hypothetical protein